MFVKDFASEKGVTVQAIYKLLRTHKEQLEGHIHSGKGGKFLDEFAMDYLDQRMVGGQNQIMDAKLQREKEQLRKERDQMQDELYAAKNVIIQMKEQQQQIAEKSSAETARANKAEADLQNATAEIEALEKEKADQAARAEAAEAELAAFKALPWYKKIFAK